MNRKKVNVGIQQGCISSLKMSANLEQTLDKVRAHVMSENEILEQKISFAWGQMKPEDKQTKEEVRNFITSMNF